MVPQGFNGRRGGNEQGPRSVAVDGGPWGRSAVGDDAQLGLMLLCLGVGSVMMMPLAGGLAARFGCRRAILAAGAVIVLCMPALMLAPSIPMLAVTLAVFGASVGVLDVVIVPDDARPAIDGTHLRVLPDRRAGRAGEAGGVFGCQRVSDAREVRDAGLAHAEGGVYGHERAGLDGVMR